MMERRFRGTCVVSAHGCKQNAGASGDTTSGSCSGVILDWKRGILVTHASLLLPFLDVKSTDDLHTLLSKTANRLKFAVILEEIQPPSQPKSYKHSTSDKINVPKSNADHMSRDTHSVVDNVSLGLENVIDTLDQYFTSLVNIDRIILPAADSQHKAPLTKKHVSYQGNVRHIWRVNSFAAEMSRLMPASDGWEFTDEKSDSDDQVSDNTSHHYHSLLSYFILVQITNWDPYFKPADQFSHKSMNIYGDGSHLRHAVLPSERLQRCDPVYVVGTPYGTLSPPVFLNSISKGIVCNISSKSNVLILVDARCIPGTEGGAVYVGSSLHRSMLVGLVVAALCWKQTEWVGMSIVCSISEILSSLSESLVSSPLLSIERGYKDASEVRASSPLSLHRPAHPGVSVCLVLVAGSWGSGILIDPQNGLILTCAHVIRFSTHTKVRVSFAGDTNHWHKVKPIYCSSEGTVYDVALLQLPASVHMHHQSAPVRIASPQEGDPVIAVGHACFNERKRLAPSVTSGVISKVMHHDKDVVMIQSTCGVVAGASGGALVSTSGALVGLLICNTKDADSGASYPHVNMSVPMCALWPTIQAFLKTKDKSILEGLKVEEPAVKNMWSLKSNSAMSNITSKL